MTLLGSGDPAYRLLGKLNERNVWLADPMAGVRTVKLADGTRREMTPTEKDAYQRRTGEQYKDYILKNGEALAKMPPDEARKKISKDTRVLRMFGMNQALRR